MEALIGWRILSLVEEIRPGKSARAQMKFWNSDYTFEVLMLEAMAQAGGLVIGAAKDFQTNLVFAKVENAEFGTISKSARSESNPALLEMVPLLVEAFARDGVSEQGSWIEAQVTSGTQKIASAKLFLIDAGDLVGSGKSVTFHSEFLNYYKVREKIIHA